MVNLSQFRFAIFDADGTLFDTMRMYDETFTTILAEKYSINPEESLAFYRTTAGMPLKEQFRTMIGQKVPDLRVNEQELEDLVSQFFDQVCQKPSPLFPKVKEVLWRIGMANLKKLFLFSGTLTDILKQRLDRHGLGFYFKQFIGAGVIPKGLGHIEVFARVMNIRREEFCRSAFLVSDGPEDMKLGLKARIYTIGLTTTVSEEAMHQAGAREIIPSIADLLERFPNRRK